MTPPPPSFGPWLLQRRLAVGGMGEVWLARRADTPKAEWVALKRVLPHLARDEAFARGFLDEVRIAARLSHPNIARILDFGEVDGDFFVALEWVRGPDLRRLLERTALPLSATLELGRAAALALHAAHTAVDAAGRALGVVHRDVSPHNLLVAGDGVVKLIDFGVASSARGALDESSLVGKASYLAPEAMDGEGDARSDQFSLGVVLWEALTGQRLFARDDDAATLAAVEACHVPPPSSVKPVPAQVDAVVVRMLARSPLERFRDAADAADALAAAQRAVGGGGREALATAVLGAFGELVAPPEAASHSAASVTATDVGEKDGSTSAPQAGAAPSCVSRQRPEGAEGGRAPGSRGIGSIDPTPAATLPADDNARLLAAMRGLHPDAEAALAAALAAQDDSGAARALRRCLAALPPAESRALARLLREPGALTVDEAEGALTADTASAAPSVLEVLEALVDRGLLHRDDSAPDAVPRFAPLLLLRRLWP